MTVSKTIVAVPEPTTLAMVALGAGLLIACSGSAENCAKFLIERWLRSNGVCFLGGEDLL